MINPTTDRNCKFLTITSYIRLWFLLAKVCPAFLSNPISISSSASSENLFVKWISNLGTGWGPWQFSQRIVGAIWALAAVVLMYTLKGTLVSSLSVPKYEPVVNSFDDLARSDSLKIMAYKGTDLHDRIMVMNFIPIKSLNFWCIF